MRFSREERQNIIERHARKHNGIFRPETFLEEVREEGPDHPAYAWFEWNQQKAAEAYNLEQAREFARGLRVTFTVETVGRASPVRIAERSIPAYVSPIRGRKDGGGYVYMDPTDPEHRAELCAQAARDLKAWLTRYEAVFSFISADTSQIEALIAKINSGPSTRGIAFKVA